MRRTEQRHTRRRKEGNRPERRKLKAGLPLRLRRANCAYP